MKRSREGEEVPTTTKIKKLAHVCDIVQDLWVQIFQYSCFKTLLSLRCTSKWLYEYLQDRRSYILDNYELIPMRIDRRIQHLTLLRMGEWVSGMGEFFSRRYATWMINEKCRERFPRLRDVDLQVKKIKYHTTNNWEG